jgi:hypothetical protein
VAWWHRFFRPKSEPPSEGVKYRVAFCLYSADGKRCAEVRERPDGTAYFVDREWVDGTIFRDVGCGEEVGPYDSIEAAEAAAVSRPWFNGSDPHAS